MTTSRPRITTKKSRAHVGREPGPPWMGPAPRGDHSDVKSLPEGGVPCTLVVLEKDWSSRRQVSANCGTVQIALELALSLVRERRISDDPVPHEGFVIICSDGVVIRLNGVAQWHYRKVI